MSTCRARRARATPITLSWTVTNQSDVAASGSWTDSLFLSDGRGLGHRRPAAGPQSFTGTLAPDGSYTLTLDTLMPAAAPGHYRVIVRTDIFNQVYEGDNEANNRSASPSTLEVAVDELVIGAPLTRTWTRSRRRCTRSRCPTGRRCASR